MVNEQIIFPPHSIEQTIFFANFVNKLSFHCSWTQHPRADILNYCISRFKD